MDRLIGNDRHWRQTTGVLLPDNADENRFWYVSYILYPNPSPIRKFARQCLRYLYTLLNCVLEFFRERGCWGLLEIRRYVFFSLFLIKNPWERVLLTFFDHSWKVLTFVQFFTYILHRITSRVSVIPRALRLFQIFIFEFHWEERFIYRYWWFTPLKEVEVGNISKF